MQGESRETNLSYEDEKGRRDQDEVVVPLQSLPKSPADVLVLWQAAQEGSLPIAMFLLFVDIGVAVRVLMPLTRSPSSSVDDSLSFVESVIWAS